MIFLVDKLDDDGEGTLRQAILDINSSSNVSNTIIFNISGNIILESSLPTIIKDSTTIEGNKQKIIIDASNILYANGLEVEADNFTVRELDSIIGAKHGIVIQHDSKDIKNISIERIENITGLNGNGIKINAKNNSTTNIIVKDCGNIAGQGASSEDNSGNGIGIFSGVHNEKILIMNNKSISGSGSGLRNSGNGIGIMSFFASNIDLAIINNLSSTGAGAGEINSGNGVGIFGFTNNETIQISNNEFISGSGSGKLNSGNGIGVTSFGSENCTVNIADNKDIQGSGSGELNSGNGVGILGDDDNTDLTIKGKQHILGYGSGIDHESVGNHIGILHFGWENDDTDDVVTDLKDLLQ